MGAPGQALAALRPGVGWTVRAGWGWGPGALHFKVPSDPCRRLPPALSWPPPLAFFLPLMMKARLVNQERLRRAARWARWARWARCCPSALSTSCRPGGLSQPTLRPRGPEGPDYSACCCPELPAGEGVGSRCPGRHSPPAGVPGGWQPSHGAARDLPRHVQETMWPILCPVTRRLHREGPLAAVSQTLLSVHVRGTLADPQPSPRK